MPTLLAHDLEEALSHNAEMWDELGGSSVFITGGTGFFGCWLLETIAWLNESRKLGIRATVLTRSPERFRVKAPELANDPAFHFVAGDVRDFAFPPRRFSHVIHAATAASAQLNDSEPLAMLDTIVQGTRRCLEFANACGARKFLFTSSGAVYGAQPPDLSHLPETFTGGPDPLDLRSAYAEGKRAAELQCALVAANKGLEVKIARCFAFVGPYMDLNAHFAIGNFIRDQMRGGPIHVRGDGKPLRSYMYASDLMCWLWTILLHGASGRAYNVGSEEAISIADLADAVSAALRPRVQVEVAGDRNRPGAANRYVPSTARAREELGLQCRVSLSDAIQRTQRWFTARAAERLEAASLTRDE